MARESEVNQSGIGRDKNMTTGSLYPSFELAQPIITSHTVGQSRRSHEINFWFRFGSSLGPKRTAVVKRGKTQR
jgi:hypothetical protein